MGGCAITNVLRMKPNGKRSFLIQYRNRNVARGAFLVHVDQGDTGCRAEKRGESTYSCGAALTPPIRPGDSKTVPFPSSTQAGHWVGCNSLFWQLNRTRLFGVSA
jgi:hypothetical protein